MEDFVGLLIEMGYEKGYAEQAVKETNSRGIEAALDWIAENPNEPGPSQSTEEASSPVASSYVCEECGKKLRNDDEMQFHSAKSGHCNFSESSEEVKALTEEERKAKMEALRVALEENKKKRLEEEKQKEVENEKRRRNQGKTLLTAKQEFREKMERLEAEEKKRQKAADKAYRAQVLAEIEKDRAERKTRQNGCAPATTTTISSAPTKSNSASTVPSDECRLQIRTPCGAPLKSTFKPTNKLVDVLHYVCNNWPDEPNGITRSVIDSEGVTLQTTFPIRKFTDEDQSSTLQELGLCPSAVIMANRLMKYY